MSGYIRQKIFQTAKTLFASELNAEFDAIKNSVNGIDQSQLNALSVGSSQLQANSVITAKLPDAAVTLAKLADGAATLRDFVHRSGGTLDTIGAGTDAIIGPATLTLTEDVPVLIVCSYVTRVSGWPSSPPSSPEAYVRVEADQDNDLVYETELFRNVLDLPSKTNTVFAIDPSPGTGVKNYRVRNTPTGATYTYSLGNYMMAAIALQR